MKEIRKQRNIYFVLLVLGLFLTAWFAKKPMVEMMCIFGLISAVALVLLVNESRLLHYANLIRDNRILHVSGATISTETIVSTFGILLGGKVYKWGADGVGGVRLKAVKIDQAKIYLAFGDQTENMEVELLHGLKSKQEVTTVQNKLLCETGVEAIVEDW